MVKQYAMLIDLDRCLGCFSCTVACKQENDLPPGIEAVPGTRGALWNRVSAVGPEGVFPNISMYYLPIMCMHCSNPPCVEACSLQAIYKREDGIVLITKDKCNGCQECIAACPYQTLYFDPEQQVVSKCTLCVHRIDNGLEPACVTACSGKAMVFGDLRNSNSKIAYAILLGGDKVFILKPEMRTGPAVRYVKAKTEEFY